MKHCQHCGDDFATPSSLKRHVTAKHPDKHDGQKQKNARHRCPHCFRDFARWETVERHIRSRHDRDWSICSFCSKQFRDDYMSQHKARCALKYWSNLQRQASLTNSDGAAQFGSATGPLQHEVNVSPAQRTLSLNGDSQAPPQDCTLRFVHERVFDVRLAADALTWALSSFEERDDVEAYEGALAIALRLNITIDVQGIRPHEPRTSFQDLAMLAIAIDQLIRGHATIDERTGKWDRTVLHNACAGGFADLLEPLFWRGASFDETDIHGQTPLESAVSSGDPDTVLFAIPLGANPNTGHPVTLAWLKEDRYIMRALVNYGADINKPLGDTTVLSWAIRGNIIGEVRFVLSLGADVNSPIYGVNPLLYIIGDCHRQKCDSCVHETIAIVLLEHGADISCQDRLGSTLFHLAIHNAQVRLLCTALERVSSCDILAVTNRDGLTALHYAVLRSKREPTHQALTMMSDLLRAGADINARSLKGVSVLGSTLGHGSLGSLLVSARRDVNAPTDRGVSALTLATNEGKEVVVRFLIDAGADVNQQDEDGHSSLTKAACMGHVRIVKLLLDARADIKARTETGFSALIFAARNGNEGMVRLLLEFGADVDAQTEGGETALSLAVQGTNKETIRRLLNAEPENVVRID